MTDDQEKVQVGTVCTSVDIGDGANLELVDKFRKI